LDAIDYEGTSDGVACPIRQNPAHHLANILWFTEPLGRNSCEDRVAALFDRTGDHVGRYPSRADTIDADRRRIFDGGRLGQAYNAVLAGGVTCRRPKAG
jgi:hypothetical protein